jgi:hypothetical protein
LTTTTKQPEAEERHVGARVPKGIADDFERFAKRNHRTVSQELRRLIEETLEQEPVEEAAA